MQADTLITAPFIKETRHGNSFYFKRLDSYRKRRQMVSSTQITKKLLQRFQKGVHRKSVIISLSQWKPGDIEQAIDKLIDAEMLLPLEKIELAAPSLELEVTNACNANCVMCPREDLRPLGMMNESVFAAILRLVESVSPSGVMFQGIGEPTLHPNLLQWISLLRRVLQPNVPIALVTNGFKMTPEFLGSLLEAGLDHLQWSFHSIESAVYNKIMGVSKYQLARQNFEACAAEYAEAMSVNAVVMDSNVDKIEELRSWLIDLGLSPSRLRLIPCFSRGGYVDTSELLSGQERQIVGRCLYVRKSLFIAWNGDLLPCSNDIAGEEVYGNLTETNSKAVIKKWQNYLLSQPMNFGICQNCDHFCRGTLETDWFGAIRNLEVSSASIAKN